MDPTSVAATLAFAGAYTAVCAFWPERKRRAWIITTIAAATASLSSLPFVFDLVKARMDVGVLVPTDDVGWRQQHALRTCSIFQGYLAADLLVGVVHYRDQITLLTGWVHHAVYIYIMQHLTTVRTEWAPIFGCVLLLELPTFLLGAGRLFPQLRNDSVFSATFLATRIFFHIFMIWSYTIRREWGPAGWLSGAFPLHAMWFAKQLTSRSSPSKNRSETDIPTTASVTSDTIAETTLDDEAAARALQSPPPELEHSTSSSATSSSPVTPEADRPDPLIFLPPNKSATMHYLQVDMHLLRHALASGDQPLRIRALLAAASRGRYVAMAARAKGLYQDASTYAPHWRRNLRERVLGPSQQGTALRREVLAH